MEAPASGSHPQHHGPQPPEKQQQQRCQAPHQRRHRRRHSDGGAAAASLLHQRQLLFSATVLLAALVLPAGVLPPAAATEINSAVSIFGPWDYELREDGGSRCTDMVQRTAELGLNTRTMFLPTLFWVSKHEDGFFDSNEVRTTLIPHVAAAQTPQMACKQSLQHRSVKHLGLRLV